MPEIFVTSDTHFGHTNIIKYCNRPFQSSEEMDETIIENWNKKIKQEDFVYFLGDFALPNKHIHPTRDDQWRYTNKIIDRLNGKIIIIFGSHDKHASECSRNFFKTYHKHTIVDVTLNGIQAMLSHCPMLSWERRTYGIVHFFGHVHSGPTKQFLCQQNSCDVGMDNWNFNPAHLDEAIQRAQDKQGKISYMDIYDNCEKG